MLLQNHSRFFYMRRIKNILITNKLYLNDAALIKSNSPNLKHFLIYTNTFRQMSISSLICTHKFPKFYLILNYHLPLPHFFQHKFLLVQAFSLKVVYIAMVISNISTRQIFSFFLTYLFPYFTDSLLYSS